MTFREAWKTNPRWWNAGMCLIAILGMVPLAVTILGWICMYLLFTAK